MAKNSISLKPLSDRVLIREIKPEERETKTKSGIIIPITVSEEKGAKEGEVVAVGPGKYENGVLIPMTVKIGNNVLFSWGDKIILDGEEYFIVRESEILAVAK